MSTNHELARSAAEKCHRYDTENFDCMDEMTRDIADTYAAPMADLERLTKESEESKGYRLLGEMLQQCCRDFIDNDIHADTPRDVQIDNLLVVYTRQAKQLKEQCSELERLRRQMEFVKKESLLAIPSPYGSPSEIRCLLCKNTWWHECRPHHNPDCPHNEVAK